MRRQPQQKYHHQTSITQEKTLLLPALLGIDRELAVSLFEKKYVINKTTCMCYNEMIEVQRPDTHKGEEKRVIMIARGTLFNEGRSPLCFDV